MIKPDEHVSEIVPQPPQVAGEKANVVQSGIILPSDIRIRLVRAESASLDTILCVLYSSMFSVFGLFLGIVLTKGKTSTTTEVASVIALGVFSVVILVWWIKVKVKQSEKGVSVPSSILQEYES